MIDPGWAAAGAVVAVNIVGWVINRSYSSRDDARREGKITAQLNDLCHRVDRLEKRIDEFLARG